MSRETHVRQAGSLAGPSESSGFALFAEMKLEKITMEAMRNSFEVSALGPLLLIKYPPGYSSISR